MVQEGALKGRKTPPRLQGGYSTAQGNALGLGDGTRRSQDEFRAFLRKHEIEYDEQYVWD